MFKRIVTVVTVESGSKYNYKIIFYKFQNRCNMCNICRFLNTVLRYRCNIGVTLGVTKQ